MIVVDLEAEEFAGGMVGGELSEMMRVKCWTFPRTTSTGEGRGMPVSVREVVSQINWGGTRRRGKDSVGFEGLRPKSF